jgi:hypothetical protein
MEQIFHIGEGALPPKKAFEVYIDGEKYEFHQETITAEDILKKVNKNPPGCFSVYKDLEGCDFKLIRPGDEIDLRELGKERFIIKAPVIFNYSVNAEHEATDQKEMTPAQIMQRAAIDSTKYYLVQKFKDKPEQIYAWNWNVKLEMLCTGMTFESRPWLEVADIEALGKKCQPVPVARYYEIKIQNQKHRVNHPILSEEQIIRLGGKADIACWDVLLFFSNQAAPVKLEDKGQVDLTRSQCLLYFVLQPRKQQEGRETRQQFTLPAEDQQFLNQQGLPWETLLTPEGHCLLIHDFPIPAGYNVAKAKMILKIPPTYPASQIDMAYFSPTLSLTSGKQIRALTPCQLDRQPYQQWSRHRQAGEWTPGVDNCAMHIHLVKNWLLNETTL